MKPKHKSHTHTAGAAFTSGGGAHVCTGDKGGATNCGYTGATTHQHDGSGGAESPAHTHPITTYTVGASNLGSPNWWEHTHTITGTTGAASSHVHPKSTLCFYDGCDKQVAGEYPCLDTPHTHGQGGSANTNAEASHTHSFSGVTGYANQAGTPENHVHPFNFNLAISGVHTHTITIAWAQNANVCVYGRSHSHTGPSPTASANHQHNLSSDTGSGGEALPVVAQPQGDGLTFTV